MNLRLFTCSIISAIALAFGSSVSGQTVLTLEAESATGLNQVDIVIITTSPDLESLNFSVTYDTDELDVLADSVEWIDSRVPTDATRDAALTPGNFAFSVTGQNDDAGVNDGSGEIARFTVTLLQAATVSLAFSNETVVPLNDMGDDSVTGQPLEITVASIAFAVNTGVAVDETDATRNVLIQLGLPTGVDMLPNAVSAIMTVSDDSTATAGMDYSTTDPVTVTFPDESTNMATQSISVAIMSDDDCEQDESIIMILGNSDAIVFIDTAANQHTLTITDNDCLTVQFESETSMVDEGAGTHEVIVTLDLPDGVTMLADDVDVGIVVTVNSSAIEGDDYTLDTQTVTFAMDDLVQMIAIPLLNDNNCENDETIELEFGTTDNNTIVGDRPIHTVTILDNELDPVNANFNGTTIELQVVDGSADDPMLSFETSATEMSDTSTLVMDGGTTAEMGSLEFVSASRDSENMISKVTLTYTPPVDFTGTDRFFFFAKSETDGIRSCVGTITIDVGQAPWYRTHTFSPLEDTAEWHNVTARIADAAPDTPAIFSINVTDTDIKLSDYFSAGFRGFVPGNYEWRVRTWDPVTNSYGEFHEMSVSSFNITYGASSVGEGDANGIVELGNGLYQLDFTLTNARGYEALIERVEGTSTSEEIHRILGVFPPDGNGSFPLTQAATLEVLLEKPGDYTVSIRGFNPLEEAEGLPDFPEPQFEISVTTATIQQRPDTPTGLSPAQSEIVTIVTEDDSTEAVATVTLQWNPVAGADSYIVYLAGDSSGPILNYESIQSQPSVTVALSPGNYTWFVVAHNPDAIEPYGPWSESRQFDVFTTVDTPVFTKIEIDDTATLALILTWAPGAEPDMVDVWHYHAGMAGTWRIIPGMLPVMLVMGTNTGTVDISEFTTLSDTHPDYFRIRGFASGSAGTSKLFRID